MLNLVGAIWFGVFVIPLRPSLTSIHTVYTVYILDIYIYSNIYYTFICYRLIDSTGTEYDEDR